MTASQRNKAWDYTFVRSAIGALNCSVVDVHSCRHIGNSGPCYSLKVATIIPICSNNNMTHIDGCSSLQTPTAKARSIAIKMDVASSSASADDTQTKLRALGRVLARDTVMPVIRDLITSRLSRFDRYPDTGPAEPVNQDDSADLVPPRVRPGDRERVAYPTEQMLKYKKKLKEQDRKPTKRKMAVEQHFDDCGADMSSLVGVARAAKFYMDTSYLKNGHCKFSHW